MQPSFSGLLVTCAYLPHTTLPEGVTSPRSEQLTSMIVPGAEGCRGRVRGRGQGVREGLGEGSGFGSR